VGTRGSTNRSVSSATSIENSMLSAAFPYI
jgi:hypothetical protein